MEEIILPKLETVKEEENFGSFIIQPLYPGYGYTLGSSLRRVLLSSLEGAAISRIKIEGAPHQFSNVSGVKEDVTEIILNFKDLRLKLHQDEPATLSVNVKGPKEIKAKDIKIPSNVEIVNPELHIATVEEKVNFSMEMIIEKGRGYLPIETRPETTKVGEIAVDSLFSPILLVNAKVENTRVGQRTDFNKLTLDIKTDGSITPRQALKKAAEILSSQIEVVKNIAIKAEGKKTKTVNKPKRGKSAKTAKKTGSKKSSLKKSS